MEFWVVVAAAGAGYVAQYLQSSSEEKENQFSKISTDEQYSDHNKNLLHQLREKFCPFHMLARRRAKKDVSDEGVFRFRQLNLDSSDCSSDEKDIHTSTKNKDSGVPFSSTGLENGMALLYIGIVSGMMSAVIANRREIEKVNEKLKWTKNLVQELEEELNVREIANDDYENPNLCSPSMLSVDEPTRQTSESTNHMAAENHESMSEIEAELEAELERLEMNMKVSTFERISDFVELDPEDEVDVAQGDLKLDCFNVQELSSRLHELIESRLEARIKELETALLHSQNRACSLETQHKLSQKNFASSEIESSAYLQSPYWYHEANEETMRTMHGSENAIDIDTSVPPYDRGLIDSSNEKRGSLIRWIVAQIKGKQKFSPVRLMHKGALKQDEVMKNQMIVAISIPSSS
ncbi:putative epoxide hydrolase 4-like [Capsicum annuum]|nr:putative epoxide hydrolase 4-like [Capsicum annuum]